MNVAVVGATGLVGQRMLELLEERNFPVDALLPVGREPGGRKVSFRGKEHPVLPVAEALNRKPALALFSAGAAASLDLAPRFAEAGAVVIDNSSAWRMDPGKPLIVPEINGDILGPDDRIIANPNCSTIQLVMVLNPLRRRYGLRRVVVSTYQSVSGAGQKGVDQLTLERQGKPSVKSCHQPVDANVIPHIDVFLEDGYTREEVKMMNESRKILRSPDLLLTATCVRVPVFVGHSEAANVELEKEFNLEEVQALLRATPGVIVRDDPAELIYPTPLQAAGRDAVYVGRLRRDPSHPHTLNCWIVSDNLRKGAATNALQIAELLRQKNLLA